MNLQPVIRAAACAAIVATLLVSAGWFTTRPVAGQETKEQTLRGAAERVTAEQLKDYLDFIASDELEGRDTPSRGLDIAAKFIALNLSRWGLKPMGDQATGDRRSYFQRIPLRRRRIDAAQTSLDLNGQRFNCGDDFLPFPTKFAGTVSGQLVYVGDGWMIKAKNINAYHGVDVKGKIVIATDVGMPPGAGSADLIGKIGEDWDSLSTYTRRNGAVGAIYIPSRDTLANWERQRQARLAQSRLEALSFDEPGGLGGMEELLTLPRYPLLIASEALANALLRGEGRDVKEFFARDDAGRLPPSFALAPGKKLSVTVGLKSEDAGAQNVVAMIEGDDPALKHEYVTIGAHYDGWVAPSSGASGEAIRADTIYNAADDNGSGTVALLSMAEAFMRGPRPKRSILFIWDAGEERGLLGSYHFTANPPVPLDKIVAHFNIDMIGRTRRGAEAPGNEDGTEPNEVFIIGPRSMSTDFSELVDRVNNSYLNLKLNYRYDNANDMRFFPRSDHTPFLQQGIPVISWFTGSHEDYHRPSDSADKIDYRKMERIARAIFFTAWSVADAARRPLIDRPLPPGVGGKRR